MPVEAFTSNPAASRRASCCWFQHCTSTVPTFALAECNIHCCWFQHLCRRLSSYAWLASRVRPVAPKAPSLAVMRRTAVTHLPLFHLRHVACLAPSSRSLLATHPPGAAPPLTPALHSCTGAAVIPPSLEEEEESSMARGGPVAGSRQMHKFWSGLMEEEEGRRKQHG